MKLTITIAATLVSLAHGTRYGLLRVGSTSNGAPLKDTVGRSSNERSLFNEDFSLAFRQLFGYSTGLCMSTMPAQLSMSLAMVAPMSLAAPNMSLGAGFLSFAPGMSLAGAANGMTDVVYGSQEGTDSAPGPGGSASETHVASDTSVTDGPPSSTTTSTSPGAVAAISAAAVVAVAAVGAAVFVKNRNNVASSAYSVSVASFHP